MSICWFWWPICKNKHLTSVFEDQAECKQHKRSINYEQVDYIYNINSKLYNHIHNLNPSINLPNPHNLLHRHNRKIIKPHRILRITRRLKHKKSQTRHRRIHRRHKLLPKRICPTRVDLNTRNRLPTIRIVKDVNIALIRRRLHEPADLVFAARATRRVDVAEVLVDVAGDPGQEWPVVGDEGAGVGA